MKKVFAYLYLLCFVLVACSKANEETEGGTNNTGGGGCDTVNMKYAANVQPIIQANCYSCHGNGQSEGGVSLERFTSVKIQADNGNLIGTISHAAGYPPMPQGSTKLSDCDINKIKAWIATGALNN